MKIKDWNIKELTGYEPITSFYRDFSIADNFGIKAIKSDRLSTSFRYVGGCSNNPDYGYNNISFIMHDESEKVEQLTLFDLEPEKPVKQPKEKIKKEKTTEKEETFEFDIDYEALLEAGLLDENYSI